MPEDTPYDPYIPSPNAGGSSSQGGPRNQFGELEAQIDDTKKIMAKNVDDLYQRGAKLDDVNRKADRLAEQSDRFRTGANRVRKQMWWKDMKMRIWLGVGIGVLILIIVLPIVLTVGKK